MLVIIFRAERLLFLLSFHIYTGICQSLKFSLLQCGTSVTHAKPPRIEAMDIAYCPHCA